jgi:ATP-binding cassette subfamily B protein
MFPFLRQYDSMDCGPTCVAMICQYYGNKNISHQKLREKTQIGKTGVSLLGISEAAESVGFRTQATKISFNTLVKEAKLPAILHWNQGHFVVIYKVTKTKICIANPALGNTSYSIEEFKSYWISDRSNYQENGIALLLEPTPAFYEEMNEGNEGTFNTSKIKQIIGYVTPYKKLIGKLFVGMIVASILQLIFPFLTKSIVDVGINTENIPFINIILAAQLSFLTGRLMIEFVRNWILLHVSSRINISILTDFLIKLMRLPIAFFDSKRAGDILQRMNDHNKIENFLSGSSFDTVLSLINLIVFSIVLLVFNTSIFIIFWIATILYAFWIIPFLKKKRKLDNKRFEIATKEQGAAIQLVQGMQEIKLSGCERIMRWNWEKLQIRLFKLANKNLVLNQWQQLGGFFLNEGKNVIITFLSAKSVINGEMTLGEMLAVQYIIGQMNSPIQQLIGFVQNYQNAALSISRLNEIHEMEDEEPVSKHLIQTLPNEFSSRIVGGASNATDNLLIPFNNSMESGYVSDLYTNSNFDDGNAINPVIQLNSVSFTYSGSGNEPVLRDITLTIPKGKTTAIVGVSGSGKTSLLKLLLKFYAPDSGDIKIGSAPLKSLSHKVWRKNCGVVMQESFIFSDSIAKNIAVGEETLNIQQLNKALHIANLAEFIDRLPLGVNTKIGPEGVGISMGQKQRILIARAVYKNPEFIFLDEATNSLDASNESIIHGRLNSFFKGRTVVIVAHRLSTIKNADQIILLEKGIIREQGTHEELVNFKGGYYRLVKDQLSLGK